MAKETQQTCFRTTIGGQALIEGILMRGPEKQSIVVRRPDGGMEVKNEELKLIKERIRFSVCPLSGAASPFWTPCTGESRR